MIEIKAYYGLWKPVTSDKARDFVRFMMKRLSILKTRDDRIKWINERHLRGVTVEALFGETELFG